MDCWRKEGAADRFDCTIFTVDGKPHAKGRYQLVGGDPQRPIRYRAWDGAVLSLDDGRTLAPERCVRCDGECIVHCP